MSLIFISFFVLFVVWYIIFLWNRRRLYYYGSKVKGPFSLPIIGSLYKFIFADGTRVIEILGELSDQYSGFYTMWFGSNLKYIITIPEYIETILTSDDALEKSEEYDCFDVAVGKGLFSASVPHWKGQRKVIASYLSRQNVKYYLKTNIKFTELTIANCKNKLSKGESIDIVKELVSNTLDIAFESCFGQRPPTLSRKYNSNIIERGMEGLFKRLYILPYRSFFLFSLSKTGKEALNLIRPYTAILREVVHTWAIKGKEQINTPSEGRLPLIAHLRNSFNGVQEKIRNELILDEIRTFIVASSDTTSTTCSYMLLILGMHPEIQEKVYQEVIEVYGKSGPMDDWAKVNELKYLDLVLKETLRLFPVGPYIGRKFLDDVILENGIILPKDSTAFIPILHIQRSEKYWPDPLKFDPERFLPTNITKIHRCTYLPFSHGPRNCVGMLYGQMGVKSIIAQIVREFYVTTDYKNVKEVELNVGVLLRPKNGFKLHVQLRNP